MRKRKLYLNTISSLLNQSVALICGFILPRFILKEFGSEINGLVSSITQFLGFIALLDLGVGAVVQSSYYKPIAEHDEKSISLLFNKSKEFFRTVALILLVYVLVLCFLYPHFINSNFDNWFTISLILIISISSFAQYYFAVPHQLLLNADQHYYVQSNMQIVTLLLNTIVSIVLIKFGCSIQIVKLASSVVYLVRPIYLSQYVKKHYSIDYSLRDKNFKIEQQWNGLAQHCATVVMNNTDVMLLSVFSTMGNVSVYSVYYLVVNGIKQLINAMSNGFNSLLGDILANKEINLLRNTFHLFEWLMHTLVVFAFSIMSVLLVPFVMNYTRGITDVNYCQPIFASLMCLAQGIFCIRIPYNTMVCSAGHYKQTQNSAIIEMLINIILSVVLVYNYGLIGVAIGTIAAMTYRTVYFIRYLHENILYIRIKRVFKQLGIDILQIVLVIFFNSFIIEYIPSSKSYFWWLLHAAVVCVYAVIMMVFVNGIFYKENLKAMFSRIKR